MGSLLLFLISCNFFGEEKASKIGNAVLTEKELQNRIELYFSDLDEETAREKAIEQWANQQRVKLEIEEKFPYEFQTQEIELEEERMRLNLYTLENEYISNNLDTLISSEEIQKYYDQHRDNYKTESYIVLALYMKIPDSIANATNADEHYLLKNDKDYKEIENIGNLYASSFYFETKRWIYLEDLMREISISSYQKEELVKNVKHGIFKENGETHYVNILNYRTKTISSPLNFEIDRIKQHILIKRSNELRDKARETIINDVKEKYPISYY